MVLAMLALSMSVTASGAGEDSDERTKTRFVQITFENDLFYHSDRYYTDGFQVMWGERVGDPDFLSRPLERLLCGGEKCPDSRRVLYSQKIGQLMYTPEDITIAAPQPNDRPWAAFLYYGAESLYVGDDPTLTRTIGYQIGMVGPAALGEQVQNAVHDIFDGRDANGWGNQLDNEPGIILSYVYEKRLLRYGGSRVDGAVWLSGGGTLGNVMTYAAGSAKMAFGRNLPLQVSTSQVGPKSLPITEQEMLSTNNTKGGYGNCLGVFSACYVFFGVEGRAVARNIFLDGNTFQDNNGNIEKENFVYDFVAGFRGAFGSRTFMHGWYVDFSQTRRSSEFSSPTGEGGVQRFASITLGREY